VVGTDASISTCVDEGYGIVRYRKLGKPGEDIEYWETAGPYAPGTVGHEKGQKVPYLRTKIEIEDLIEHYMRWKHAIDCSTGQKYPTDPQAYRNDPGLIAVLAEALNSFDGYLKDEWSYTHSDTLTRLKNILGAYWRATERGGIGRV
jgi:hypothetical protein